jgi:cytochrome c-type biogenesis protein CcmH
MTALFWTVLAALIGLALLFVLPTLLGRGREAAPGGGPRPGRGRWAAYAVAGGLPPLAIVLYLVFGSPAVLNAEPGERGAGAAGPAPAPEGAEVAPDPGASLETVVADLEARVRDHADDREAWSALGRGYGSLGRYEDALKAYVEATRLGAEEAEVLSGHAEALAITRGHKLEGEPYQLLLKALERDVNDLKGLELIGVYHFQQGNYGQAAFYWRRLAKLLPPDSPLARDIEGAASEAAGRDRAAFEAPAEAGQDAGQGAGQDAGTPTTPPP